MKWILSVLLFCVSLTVAQKELTSYEREYPYFIEEFPAIAQPLWSFNIENDVCDSGAVIGKETFSYIVDGRFSVISLETGQTLWNIDGVCNGVDREIPRYFYSDGLVYVFDILNDYTLHAYQEKTGLEVWTYSFEEGKFFSLFYDKDVVFVVLRNEEFGVSKNTLAFEAQSGKVLWQTEEKGSIVYKNFEIYGETVKAEYNVWTSTSSGTAFLDLETGEQFWGIGNDRVGGQNFLYADESYIYTLRYWSGAPSVLGPVVQYDAKTRVVSKECNFEVNPPVLAQRYVFSPDLPYGLNAMLRGIVTDGEWIYATVGNDLHRFPLCGKTPAFAESIGESIEGDTSGKRKRYELPTLLFSWNNDYGYYFGSEGGSPFSHEDDLRWIAGPAEGIFLFYSDEAEELYGVDEIPRNYIETSEDKLVGNPHPYDSDYVTIHEYPAIGDEISRLDVINGMIFVGTANGVFHVFNLHTQELIFHTRVNSPNFGPFHLVDDIAIVQTLNGDVMAFKLDLPNKE